MDQLMWLSKKKILPPHMYTARVIFVMLTHNVIQKIACERMHSMPFAKVGYNDQLTEYL